MAYQQTMGLNNNANPKMTYDIYIYIKHLILQQTTKLYKTQAV